MKTKLKKTIIFSLLDTPAFGGAEQYLFSQLYYLSQHGYSVVLATNNQQVKIEILSRLTARDQKTFQLITAPYRLDVIGDWKGLVKFFLTLPGALWWCFNTLRRLKKSHSPVICLWPGFTDRLVFSPLASILHLPLIWIDIGPLEPLFRRNWGLPRWLYLFTQQFATHIVVTSRFTQNSLLRQTPFPRQKITLVYPGTKLFSAKAITSYQKKALAWAQQQHLLQTTFIGVVARLAHENEVEVVITAWAQYLKRNPTSKVLLLIIGDGPQRPELETLVDHLQLTEKVRFCGFVTEADKRILLAGCDFFIFPRAWELDGFGMTTIEAMSLGLPVLTTDFGPQREIVTNGKEGFRYQPHDSQDLAHHIEMLQNLTLKKRQAMGRAALKRAADFSDTTSHQKMLRVIEAVMQ